MALRVEKADDKCRIVGEVSPDEHAFQYLTRWRSDCEWLEWLGESWNRLRPIPCVDHQRAKTSILLQLSVIGIALAKH
jgi:hypothetical protein